MEVELRGGRASDRPGACGDEVCTTCSDSAVPSRIIELRGEHLAVAEIQGTRAVISVALVDAAPGDTVLVHAREAIAVVERA
ncbi:MAG TPA: HypC/HybG/HupF family hydrogenase formation chaperone [Candidatus Binatia bacterium]|nr:HypC/HybG/HupF family hydrogenase formation chaperone [Candidatus Binatia bacterium]